MIIDFLDTILGVNVNETFSCGGYFYRVIEFGTRLQVETVNGWIDCAHPEVIAVYQNKDKIHFEERENENETLG